MKLLCRLRSFSHLLQVVLLTLALALILPLLPANQAIAAPIPVKGMCMFSYGGHNAAYDARLLNIVPEYLIDNPAHGFWGEYTGSYTNSSLLQNVAGMKAAGMKVIGYTSCGYEGAGSAGGQPISMFTLDSVKKQIKNMAQLDGVDGVFIDEVSSYPNATKKQYLKELSTYAHSLGIIIWANTGVDSFDSWFFNDGGFDFVHSTERWVGGTLTSTQSTYGSRISVAGFQSSYTAADAVRLTKDAWSKGIRFCYVNNAEYQTIAPWFEEYANAVRGTTPPTPPPASNNPPVLSPIGSKIVQQDELLQFKLSASDPDGNTLTYSASNLPSGATFYASTATFSWRPPKAGTYSGITFTVSDGSLTDSETITISVMSPTPPPVPDNNPPVLSPISNKTGVVSQLLQFQLSASDPDGDALSYWASNLPSGATFYASTATFSWRPLAAGTYTGIVFTVSDGNLTDSEAITINVVASPETPPTAYETTARVACGADDGFSGPWGFYNKLGWYEIGNPGRPYNAWFRFANVRIPTGAKIVQAYIQTKQSKWTRGTHLKIRADKSTLTWAPRSTADHLSRVRTVAAVDWDTGYADWRVHRSPDISGVIQELVNTYNYSGGRPIQILVDNDYSIAGNEHVGLAFEGGSAPTLYIKYQIQQS